MKKTYYVLRRSNVVAPMYVAKSRDPRPWTFGPDYARRFPNRAAAEKYSADNLPLLGATEVEAV